MFYKQSRDYRDFGKISLYFSKNKIVSNHGYYESERYFFFFVSIVGILERKCRDTCGVLL